MGEDTMLAYISRTQTIQEPERSLFVMGYLLPLVFYTPPHKPKPPMPPTFWSMRCLGLHETGPL